MRMYLNLLVNDRHAFENVLNLIGQQIATNYTAVIHAHQNDEKM